MQGTFLLYKAENEGYFDPEWRRTAGGGPILINMVHEVGNMRALCGEIAAVHAFSSNATRGFAVEDTACINVRFANGALGSFIASDTAASTRSWEHTSGEDPRYALAHVSDDDCYVIAGTMGSLSIPTMRLKTFSRAADQSWHKPLQTQVLTLPNVDPMHAQMAHFCGVIRGQAPPMVSALDGLQNLKIVEAISDSARTGLAVAI
jgi:predicted dehydrogenase